MPVTYRVLLAQYYFDACDAPQEVGAEWKSVVERLVHKRIAFGRGWNKRQLEVARVIIGADESGCLTAQFRCEECCAWVLRDGRDRDFGSKAGTHDDEDCGGASGDASVVHYFFAPSRVIFHSPHPSPDKCQSLC
jgi:hypothetical protein